MHSSTSNSRPSDQHDDFVRPVPHGNWAVSFIVAALITIVTLGVWEMHLRSEGYWETLDETGDLWAANRTELANSDPKRTVVIGSSRIQFNLDLDEYAKYFKTEKPIQLAIPGAIPLPALEDIASDDRFTGTLICGVTPGLYFAPHGMPVDKAYEALERYEDWSPSQRTGHYLGMALDSRLAFLNQEDLTLPVLFRSLNIANRAEAQMPPVLPPYFASVTSDRRARMWEGCDFDSPLAKRIQNIWIPLFTPPPPPPGMTHEDFMGMFMQSVESYLARTQAAVETIRGRGGKVVFIRMPSSNTLREMENKFSPRPVFWEAILERTGAPGIHFEDYPELSEFSCPEWSHLRSDQADEFSKRLMPILAEALAK